MASKKILVISKGFYPETGGLEKYSEKVTEAYRDLGYEVTVLTACSKKLRSFAYKNANVLNVGIGSQYWVFFKMFFKLLQLRLFNKYYFVHATSWKVAIPAIIVGYVGKVYISVHGAEIFRYQGVMSKVMVKVFSLSSGIAVVSKPILEKARQIYPSVFQGNVKVIWNGISFPSESEVTTFDQKKPNMVFCMCRLVQRKNLVRAIQAISKVNDEGVSCEFYIAGAGEDEPRVSEQIKACKASSYIKYLGRITDEHALHLYKESLVFLHPQITTSLGKDIEGFGISIADAMSFGCVPVVGAEGGPADFIVDGLNGLIVDGMNVDEIASALKKLLNDKCLSKEMSISAQKFSVDNLTWNAHVNEFLSLVNCRG